MVVHVIHNKVKVINKIIVKTNFFYKFSLTELIFGSSINIRLAEILLIIVNNLVLFIYLGHSPSSLSVCDPPEQRHKGQQW